MSGLTDVYVNPLTDFGFKKIFGEEPNKDILIAFLNDILPGDHVVEDLQYLKNEKLGQSQEERKAIFDLYCTTESGEKFIVELQKVKQNYFKDRSVYYSSFPIQEQAQKGDWNFKLEAVYTVGILDFTFDEHRDDEELYHVVELKNQRNEVFYDKLKYIYIELPKFRKEAEELESRMDKWLYVFRHLAGLDDRPEPLKERIFEKLFEVARISNFSPEERTDYEQSLKYYRDLVNVVDTSREEGREEGREEAKKAIAKSLIAEGVPVSVIEKTTGLSASEIDSLN